MDFPKLTFNKHAMQSSTYANMAASRALDSTTICARTKSSENPWWLVDLFAEYDVKQVALTKRPGKY